MSAFQLILKLILTFIPANLQRCLPIYESSVVVPTNKIPTLNYHSKSFYLIFIHLLYYMSEDCNFHVALL